MKDFIEVLGNLQKWKYKRLISYKQEAHGSWRSAWEPTWPLTKVPEVAHILSFYTREGGGGVEIELIFALWEAFLAWNFAVSQSSRSCTYTLSTPGRWNWAYVCSMDSLFWDIGDVLQKLPYLAMKLAISQYNSRSCTYSPSTPRDRNWAHFRSMGSCCRDTSWFSKLPYLRMKLGHWQKFRKLYILSFYHRGCNWAYFCSTGSVFRDAGCFSLGKVTPFYPCCLRGSKLSWICSTGGMQFPRYKPIFKIAIFGHETWPLAKVPEVSHILTFYPRGMKLSLFFSLYEHRFPIFRRILKIAMLGHETWPLAKVPEVAHILSVDFLKTLKIKKILLLYFILLLIMGSLARPGQPHMYKYKVQDVIEAIMERQQLPRLTTWLVSTWLIDKVRKGTSLPIMARL